MIELENLEPGLSSKITHTFRTKNFARNTAGMLRDMYHDRADNPGRNYVMDLVAQTDHNLAFANSLYSAYLFYALRKRGIGFETHEFSDDSDLAHADRQALARKAEGGQITDLSFRAHGTQINSQASRTVLIGPQQLRLLKNVQSCLLPDASILVSGCSTGKLEANVVTFAEEIHKFFARQVVAPNIDALCYLSIKSNARLELNISRVEKNRRLMRLGCLATLGVVGLTASSEGFALISTIPPEVFPSILKPLLRSSLIPLSFWGGYFAQRKLWQHHKKNLVDGVKTTLPAPGQQHNPN